MAVAGRFLTAGAAESRSGSESGALCIQSETSAGGAGLGQVAGGTEKEGPKSQSCLFQRTEPTTQPSCTFARYAASDLKRRSPERSGCKTVVPRTGLARFSHSLFMRPPILPFLALIRRLQRIPIPILLPKRQTRTKTLHPSSARRMRKRRR